MTAQNSRGVLEIFTPPGTFVVRQIEAVMTDIGVQAAKTGMLANAEIIGAVAEALERWPIERLVVDPVMVATSGDLLLEADAVDLYREKIIPLAALLTPNLDEAEALTGRKLRSGDGGGPLSEAAIEEAGRELLNMGARAVLIKGGHFTDAEHCNDYLCTPEGVEVIAGERIDCPNVHGSGCTLSAAIAARLAWGESLRDAVIASKLYISDAIRHSYPVGGGPGPLNHAWAISRP